LTTTIHNEEEEDGIWRTFSEQHYFNQDQQTYFKVKIIHEMHSSKVLLLDQIWNASTIEIWSNTGKSSVVLYPRPMSG
jgi:hypothetical protein